MPEMGVEGEAEVLDIGPARVDDVRPGLVTGTFRHSSGDVYELKLESEAKPIGVTGTHPFWSVDREAWVSVLDLEIGETLETLEGTTVVESLYRRTGSEPVYNIEVEGDHCYRVGESGVLVHNQSAPTPGVDFGCGKLSGQGNCSRGTQDQVRPDGYQIHHLIGVNEAKEWIVQRACQLGYDVNRRNNAEAYPSYGKKNPRFLTVTDGQNEALAKDLPLHSGSHKADNYQFCVRRYLSTLERRYEKGEVSDCNLCEELTKIEHELRRSLKAHELWLNPHDPHISSSQTPSCNAST